jgi:hypothetical protein
MRMGHYVNGRRFQRASLMRHDGHRGAQVSNDRFTLAAQHDCQLPILR